jgi:HlyD family secretion protein
MSQRVPAAALEFQGDLDRILQAPPPRILRGTCLALAFMIVALIAASALLTVEIVVTGPGVLATDHPTALLQSLDRAVVRSLQVRAGDHVVKGQILATLDPTFAQADYQSLHMAHILSSGDIARLQVEEAGGVYQAPAGSPPQYAIEATISQARRAEYESRVEAFDQTLAHEAAEQATARGDLASLQKQAAIAHDVLRLREDLLHGAIGSRLQYLDAAHEAARADGAVTATTNRLVELSHALRSTQADRQTFIDGWRREILEELRRTQAALAKTDADMAKAARMQELARVTAPEDGVVLQVAARAPGSISGGADPLIVLLPAHAALTAEITIKSSDIGYLRVGDPVQVKVDAYPFQKHGVLHGRVRAIAAASQPPAGAPADGPFAAAAVHRVSVDLDGARLQNLPDGAEPIPGMTISGDVKVGTRSVLAYFLAPVTRGFAQSLREP